MTRQLCGARAAFWFWPIHRLVHPENYLFLLLKFVFIRPKCTNSISFHFEHKITEHKQTSSNLPLLRKSFTSNVVCVCVTLHLKRMCLYHLELETNTCVSPFTWNVCAYITLTSKRAMRLHHLALETYVFESYYASTVVCVRIMLHFKKMCLCHLALETHVFVSPYNSNLVCVCITLCLNRLTLETYVFLSPYWITLLYHLVRSIRGMSLCHLVHGMQDQLAEAESLKQNGNTFYKEGNYEQALVRTSDAVLVEISLRSPQNLFIFTIKKTYVGSKYSTTKKMEKKASFVRTSWCLLWNNRQCLWSSRKTVRASGGALVIGCCNVL